MEANECDLVVECMSLMPEVPDLICKHTYKHTITTTTTTTITTTITTILIEIENWRDVHCGSLSQTPMTHNFWFMTWKYTEENINKGKGIWDDVCQKPGGSFHSIFPSGVTQDMLNFPRNKFCHYRWNAVSQRHSLEAQELGFSLGLVTQTPSANHLYCRL